MARHLRPQLPLRGPDEPRRRTRAAARGRLAGAPRQRGRPAARQPDSPLVDYAAAKTALLSLSKSLAVEFGPRGVRSNVVSPGPTRTRLWDAPGGFAEQLAEGFGLPVEAAVDHFVREPAGPAHSAGRAEREGFGRGGAGRRFPPRYARPGKADRSPDVK
ncbi:SDR family oxidoreductase [Kitasatospora sp. NPDC001574]